jgi:hypothetical protein
MNTSLSKGSPCNECSFLFFLQQTQLLDISVPADAGPAGVVDGSGSRGQNGMKT